MSAEFQKELLKVDPSYGVSINKALMGVRVTASGWFGKTGTFEVVNLGEKTGLSNTTHMWAGDLLQFEEAQDGLYATRAGTLQVYHGRMNRVDRSRGIDPIHTIYPINIRFVDEFDSFRVRVGQSGYIFNERAAWRQRLTDDNPLKPERLEEILTEAEVGKRPPFFDDQTQYVKVEPGFAGKIVHVIKFSWVNDLVVVDAEQRKLVAKKVEPILSKRRWEESTETKS